MGGYRQWQLPSELGEYDSGSVKNQILRFDLILNQ